MYRNVKILTKTETNGARYGSSFVTFYNKELGFCLHRSSVIDLQAVVEKLSYCGSGDEF